MQRPSWDNYFKEIVKLTATHSPCTRLQVDCILVKIIALFLKDIMGLYQVVLVD